MELPSVSMIKTFVAADVGISIISESFRRDQVKTGEVKLLNVEGVDLWRELALVLSPRSQLASRRPIANQHDPRKPQTRRSPRVK